MTQAAMSDDTYEIYAVKYGRHERKAAENYIGGDPHDGMEPIDYFVWAIVGPGGTYIVDTGFDEAMAQKRKRVITKPIAEGLKAIGIDADKVENVIVSHLHYDHTGNYDLFPRARYHLQDIEMGYATGRHMCHAHLKLPFEEEDVVAMVRKVFAGRVAFHDGVDQIAPGITVHKVGGHSKGLQCVRVKTRRGYVVLAADATHLYSHIEQGRVFPITFHIGEVLDGYETIKKLATSAKHIIPGHDPQVLERYAPARPGLENWVVRLDADPK
jgi:glyoxylase-like metal-dependent hydrolase (beta-lactamase superfamily II)